MAISSKHWGALKPLKKADKRNDRFLNHPNGFLQYGDIKYFNGYRVRDLHLLGTKIPVPYEFTNETDGT